MDLMLRLSTLLCLCAGLGAQSDKLDAGLGGDHGPQAVFVRMKQQWLPDARAYAAFCKQHRDAPRRSWRQRGVERLKALAAASHGKIAARLAELEGVAAIQRYWVVNGFGCQADGKACEALAAHPEVAFIYRKPARVPAMHQIQRGSGRSPLRVRREIPALLAALEKPTPLPDLDQLQLSFNLQRIRTAEAWATGAMGQGTTIALLDSGLLLTPALTQALWHNDKETLNGKDDDGNGFIDDLFGYDFRADTGISLGDRGRCHGSMCGGIIASRPVKVGEKYLATGIAPKARLMVIRGMGVLRAYEYALQMGADVMSMSYMFVNIELGNWRGIYRLAHEHMTAAGLVAVGGSGNFARRAPAGKQICMPKDIPCVISASGLNEQNELPPFSSLGPCSWSDVVYYKDHGPDQPLIKPDVTGFSMDFPVWSSLRAWPARGNRVRHVHDAGDGTGLIIGAMGNSFAGPHAAGVAALMLSAHPDLPAFRVKELMEQACKDLGQKGKDTRYGAGLLDAAKAVALARAAKGD